MPVELRYRGELRLKRRFREYYAGVWALTEGKPANLEAETSTIRKPSRTLANLRKAVNDGRMCLLAVPDGRDEGDDLGH